MSPAGWRTALYVENGDVGAVAAAIAAIAAAEGRAAVVPDEPTPATMQELLHGGASAARWAVAIMPGAPGWSVVQSAPRELLAFGRPPRLALLARALGCSAFQHSVYDGAAALLLESDARGRVAVSGAHPEEPQRFRDAAPTSLVPAFRFIEPDAAIAAARARGDSAVIVRVPALAAELEAIPLAEQGAQTRRWLERVGQQVAEHSWRVAATDVVARLVEDVVPLLEPVAEAEALAAVFAAANATHAGGPLVAECLVSHRPQPVWASETHYFDLLLDEAAETPGTAH